MLKDPTPPHQDPQPALLRIVVSGSRGPRDPRSSRVGCYDAVANPPKVTPERARALIARGAQASATVRSLLEREESAS
jgi:ribosomal protein S16